LYKWEFSKNTVKLIYHYPNDNSNSFFPEKKLLPISFFFRKIKSEKAKISSNNHWLFKKHSVILSAIITNPLVP